MGEIDVLDKIIRVFEKISDVENITKESNLFDDLELSSLESFVALGELEETFGIRIPEKMLLKMITINDVYDIVTELMNNQS